MDILDILKKQLSTVLPQLAGGSDQGGNPTPGIPRPDGLAGGLMGSGQQPQQPIDLSGPVLPRQGPQGTPRDAPRGAPGGAWAAPIDGGAGWGYRPPGPAWGPSSPSWGPAPAWGSQDPGRTTTYRAYMRPDGSVGRCAISQWRSEPMMRCE